MFNIVDTFQSFTVDTFDLINEVNYLVGTYERLIIASKLVVRGLDKYLYEGSHDDLLSNIEGYLFIVRHRNLLTDYSILTSQQNMIPLLLAYKRLGSLVPVRFGHMTHSEDILVSSKYRILSNLLAPDSTYKVSRL